MLYIFFISCLKLLLSYLAGYIFYYRVWDYTRAYRFYSRQGSHVCRIQAYYLPILGNAYRMAWSAYKSIKEGDNYFILKHALDEDIKDAGTLVSFITNGAGLAIRDVKVIEALYTTKNRYFDKHPIIKELCYCLTGDSILFAETTEDWRKSRKAISPAFYKGKLEKMVEIAKKAARTTLARWVLPNRQAKRSAGTVAA